MLKCRIVKVNYTDAIYIMVFEDLDSCGEPLILFEILLYRHVGGTVGYELVVLFQSL